ncbi:MAG TPA: hypothetical protein VEF03_08945 [Candidatus Binataceae bacterium]|nr:hypothetical protein [Candidatus Binataceae bacterium]
MAQSADELIERISRLEFQHDKLRRSNQNLRLMAGGLMLLCVALFTTAETKTAVSDTVEAQQFLLRDSSGKLRGAMGVTQDGAVGLNLEDSNGRSRLTVDLAVDGTPGVDLLDKDGNIRATIALGEAGEPGVGLYGPGGRLRTSLDIPAAKTPGLAFYRPDGTPAWGVP